MFWTAVILFVVGVVLSAFFSGSETGFYRANRMRIVLDSLDGDRLAGWLLWLTNQPSLFVATILVGNNVANYLTSLAVVLGVPSVLPAAMVPTGELLAPVLLAPLLFLYGELVPKHVYYQAPNLMLKRTGPLVLLFTFLLAPISMMLWTLSRFLERLTGQAPPQVELIIAREELEQFLVEGHEAGLLSNAQRQLTQSLLLIANRPIAESALTVSKFMRVRLETPQQEVIRLAKRYHLSYFPVENPQDRRLIIGYVRVLDCKQDPPQHESAEGRVKAILREIPALPVGMSHLQALQYLHKMREPFARIVDSRDRTQGLVTTHRLVDSLFRGS
ncbi:CNNM transmembrane domain-containing protein [Planctomycetales bacterium 10988]|nr:CNNM transmembrane domain-containing protein [Planctomycetales bacterium 10988]